MSNRADSVRVAHPLFQAEGGGSTPTSALDLRFYQCDTKTFVRFNELWHSRLPKIGNAFTARVCYWALCDDIAYAVAMWSNPVARLLPQREWLELRRFAIAPDAPKNLASRMIAWMVRDIRKKFPAIIKLISYQDTEVHKGTIYKASGWVPVKAVQKIKTGWNSRPDRNRMQSTAAKIRWEKILCDKEPTQ